ncbi:hypothetical protein vseg_006432 [Gypsophila vaccaria]
MNSTNIKQVSQTFIKPKHEVQNSKQPYYLAPMDLSMLSLQYIQQGLMFLKPSHSVKEAETRCHLVLPNHCPVTNDEHFSIHTFLDALKDSLSRTLVHFYPLAGRLESHVDEELHQSVVYVDCSKGPGACFVYATLDVIVSDILSPSEVPSLVHSFFDHNDAVNHHGHDKPLLSVRVTELVDAVFIAASTNHSVLDGTSYWHFWNVWSEIHNNVHADSSNSSNSGNSSISINLPVHNRWFSDGYGPVVTLPYTNPSEFITTHEETNNIEKIFHFSAASVAKLRAQAREESGDSQISSLQALTALLWRSIVEAKGGLAADDNQIFNCILVANDRHRLIPNLPKNYFGNCIGFVENKVRAKELVAQTVGWAASLLRQSVDRHDNEFVRESAAKWLKSRTVYKSTDLFNSNTDDHTFPEVRYVW